jgi:hypothetical protein
MAAELADEPDKLVSLKSNTFFALLDPGGHFKEAPMGAPILLTDAAGFLSPSESSTANSEDLSASSTIGLYFGNFYRTLTQWENRNAWPSPSL